MSFRLLPAKYDNPVQLLNELRARDSLYWIKRGETRALALFHEMANRVPAYKSFLKQYGLSPSRIKKSSDFSKIPALNKNNYLRVHPMTALAWDGKFKERSWEISMTSGSTGVPFYFPREEAQDMQYAGTAELYLRTNFDIHKKSTLYINAFPMGAWIGGVFTYEAITRVAARGNYALSIITPGIDKKEIINSVKRFGHEFDQIIIGCYGPFLKDAIDEGIAQGVGWKSYPLKFIFSAEGFSETFRDYIIEHAGLKNPYKDTLNHYGTVDQGTLAHETPVSIMIRRLALKTPALYKDIFPVEHKLPTLAQYDPELFFFEEAGGNLLCTAASGLPLVRYDLKDHGGVIYFEDMRARFARHGLDLLKEAKKAGILDTVWRLPFVYVYERSDFSVSLYAFQVYPETIRKALQERQFSDHLTGKFTMLVTNDKSQNQRFELHVELKINRKNSKILHKNIEKAVTKYLLAENSEYRKTHNEHPSRVKPYIVLWPYGEPLYFKSGGKQKWVLKSYMNNIQKAAYNPIKRPAACSLEKWRSGLVRKDPSLEIIDAYTDLLNELFLLRNPSCRFNKNYEKEFNDFLVKNNKSGEWFYFPWLHKIVRYLPERLHQELRTGRNRHLITKEEQQKYYEATVGIAGMSVGSHVALTIAMTGGAKHIKLADPDIISGDNLNRIRSGYSQVGLSKAAVVARQIAEMNPYAHVDVFPEGITESNVKRFLQGLTVLVEEMDNPFWKLNIRYLAREKRIPVIMGTDNGDGIIVDVERYDCSSRYAILHGLAHGLTPAALLKLDPRELPRIAAKIAGAEHAPLRMLQSVSEVGKSLYSWPQLGTAATMCGAILSYLVRRIVVGAPGIKSGRYLVNPDAIFENNYFSARSASSRAKNAKVFLNKLGLNV
ncbi:MAG: ThiF family adenylyltransferase [Candidatus Liptonbacteria bacterium]